MDDSVLPFISVGIMGVPLVASILAGSVDAMPTALKTRKVGGSIIGVINFILSGAIWLGTHWTTPGDVWDMISTLGIWFFVLAGVGIIAWANWPTITARVWRKRHLESAQAAKRHGYRERLVRCRDTVKSGSGIKDFTTWHDYVVVQQDYVIVAMREAKADGLIPEWMIDPLSKEPRVQGAWVSLILAMAERSMIVHPDVLAMARTSPTQWIIDDHRRVLFSQHTMDAISKVIDLCFAD